MGEEKAREAIAALWRNHPSGASTFHLCFTEGCPSGARDTYCDECIVNLYKGSRAHLDVVLRAIKQLRSAERDLVDVESRGE